MVTTFGVPIFRISTLKAPIMTAADDIHKYFFIVFHREIRLDVSSESSARQRIHMKNQALFSLKNKSKRLKCRLLQFLFGTLRVNGTCIFFSSPTANKFDTKEKLKEFKCYRSRKLYS